MANSRRWSDQEILESLVLRARRVRAHSIVQKGNLEDYKGLYSLRMFGESAELSQVTPWDEELFESFAARVRPVTLEREPVYYGGVVDAIEKIDIGDSARALDSDCRELLDNLRPRWDSTVNPPDSDPVFLAFMADQSKPEEPLKWVTMQQLAEAWMYADVVHTAATGPKRDGLAFPLKQRYAAAVNYYSRLADVVLDTGDLVLGMKDAGLISLDRECQEADVGPVAS